MVLSDRGIEDRRQALGVIEWKDIRRLSIREMPKLSREPFLAVDVFDPEKYLSRLTRWTKVKRFLDIDPFASATLVKRGYPAIAVRFLFLEPSLDAVWDYLRMHHRDLTGP